MTRPTAPQLISTYIKAYRETHRDTEPHRGVLPQLGRSFKLQIADQTMSDNDLKDLAQVAGRLGSLNLNMVWGIEEEKRTRGLEHPLVERPTRDIARGRDGYGLAL